MPLKRLIKEKWNPEKHSKETDYRDDLLSFLRKNSPKNARLEPEYRDLGTTTDIYLSWGGFLSTCEVYVEIKRELTKKSKLDRLVGQIEYLEPSKRNIIIVLVEEVTQHFLERLREKYYSELRGDVGMRILHVSIK